MKSLLYKELKLSSLAVTYFFIAFGLMTFFARLSDTSRQLFVCMGIFYSFQFSKGKQRPAFHRAAARGENRRREGKVPVCACCSGAFLFAHDNLHACKNDFAVPRRRLRAKSAFKRQPFLSWLLSCNVRAFQFDFVRVIIKPPIKSECHLLFTAPPPCCLWASTRPLFTYRGLRLFRSRIFPLWVPKLSVFWRDLRFSPP